MGIYDRDYYRENTRGFEFFGRSRATVALVILFVTVYLCQIALREPPRFHDAPAQDLLTKYLALDADKVLKGEVWRVVTYAFVHDVWNLFHFLFSILFLAWIGHQVEDIYDAREYLAYFLLTTILGGLAYTSVAAIVGQALLFRGPSAAVTAILFLYALHYPSRTIQLFFVVPVPIWAFIALYAVFDVMALTNGAGQGAAVAVHAVGALFALAYYRWTLRVLNWVPSLSARRLPRTQSKAKLRLYDGESDREPAATASSLTSSAGAVQASSVLPAPTAAGPVDEQLEAKLDEVLQKVSRSGRDSLTPSEQDILRRASEIYKKRRSN